jgi:hypothetical protein
MIEISRMRAQQTRFECARAKLGRLMPFDEWCRTVNPTETAKEMYQFVRLTLEREFERSRLLYGDALRECEPTRARGRTPRITRQPKP